MVNIILKSSRLFIKAIAIKTTYLQFFKELANMKNKKELNDNEKIFIEKNDYESGFPMIGSMNFMPSGLPQKNNIQIVISLK